MDKNVNLYRAAWMLIEASKLLRPYENDMADDLIDKASYLTGQIEVNEEEIQEINDYERRLKES